MHITVVAVVGDRPRGAAAEAERVAMATATEPRPAGSERRRPAGARRRPAGRVPDRVSVMLVGLAAFLVILALLAGQIRGPATSGYPTREVVKRRIYVTTIIDSTSGARAGTSVSQSVPSPPSTYAAPAPLTTHTS